MPETTPPFDEDVRRFLAVINRIPVRVPERDRVIMALDTVATSEWLRVRMNLEDEQILGLGRPALSFTPDELAHILEAATTIARRYGFETVGIGHVAVALAATSRATAGAIDTMAEAFGLGTLEDSKEIVNQHLLWKEGSEPRRRDGAESADEGADETSTGGAAGESAEPDQGRLVYGENIKGGRWHRAATLAHVGLRLAACCVLVVIAVRTGDLLAWPVAVAALVTTRDSREPELALGDEVSPLQPPARWPWLGFLAVVTAALGMRGPAAVIVGEYLLLDAVAYVGVRMVSRCIVIEGGTENPVGRYIARLPTVIDGYGTRRRCRRLWVVVFVAVVPATAVAAAVMSPLWPLCLLVALFAARRWTVFAFIASAVVVLLAAGSAWLLLVAWPAGLLARGAIAWLDRPPYEMVPVSVRRRVLGRHEDRAYTHAHRLVRAGRPAAALRWLETAGDPRDPQLVTLRAWALLQCGRPGEAKDTMNAAQGVEDRIRTLIVCLAELDLSNAGAADRALTAFGGVDDDMPETLFRIALIARIRLTLLNGGAKNLTDSIAMGVQRKVGRADVLFTVTLLRLAAESALSSAPKLSFLLADFGVVLSLPDRYQAPGGFLDRRRPMALENTRCVARRALAELFWKGANTETVAWLSADEGATGNLMRMDRPLEAAGILNTLADQLEGKHAYHVAVLRSRIEALAMLNATRHQLSEAEDRRHYWRVYGQTIERAMRDAAAGSDWETLTELIESARLQLGPDRSETFEASRSAPFIRVRGTSRVEQAGWYRPSERPSAYALEDIAALVLGPGTWWWSTWSTENELYWVLVPPDGPVYGGVRPLSPGSELHGVLSDLRDVLPIQHTGEDDEAFEDRVLRSPLLTGPAEAETALARRLGRLLPASLVEALRQAPEPLRLAIAPAERLANVPWACAEIQDDVRLIERCIPVIAPPSSLLAAITSRLRNSGAAPIGLAVIDPGGDLGGAEAWHPLSTARRILDLLPHGVTTVAPDDDVSLEDFAARLRALDTSTTAIFACHAVDDDGSASSRGLVLRPGTPGGRLELLTADLLIGESARFPMPAQVVLLACESADLRHTAAGEWLVLGPAMLWAGADRAIVTSFPVVDNAEGQDRDDVIDRHLLHLLTERRPLADGLRAVQLEQLEQWRRSRDLQEAERRSAPMHWAGHLAMGSFTDTRRSPTLRPARRQLVNRSVPALLDDAARVAIEAGRPTIAVRDLLLQVALYGYEDELPRWRRMLVHALGYPYATISVILSYRRRSTAPACAAPGPGVQDLLRSTEEIARVARHQVIDVEHLFVAVLAAPGALGRITRAVFGLDARQPEVVKAILSDTQHGYQPTGVPELHHLDPAAVPDTYAMLGAPVPETDDGELRLLSER
jgi:hypothetical protein